MMVGVGLPLAYLYYRLTTERSKYQLAQSQISQDPEEEADLKLQAAAQHAELLKILCLVWIGAFPILWEVAAFMLL